jgi:phosphate transport system permease protein
MKHKIRASEKASVGFVWLSAALTIGALFLILGYIIWNGLFYSNRREYQVLSTVSTELDGSVLVSNKSLPVAELPFDIVQNMFSDEYMSWKKICSEDVDLYPFVDDKTNARLTADLAIAEPGTLIAYPGDAAATVREVIGNPGGAALVDRADFEALDARVRQEVTVVRLRTVAFAANPEVTALKDNHKVGTIDESALASLYAGSVRDWSAFDGSAIPVVMVIPPESSPLFAEVRKLGYSPSTGGPSFIKAATEDEYYSLIASTPGAAGIAPSNKVASSGLSVIKLARQESGRNLTLDFILDPPKESGKIGGISTIILNTFAMILLTLLFSIPPGLFAAIYLVEYAKEGRLIRLIRLGTETLAGVPSIIFGLFGMLVFVQGFGWGISLISGSLTVTLMILPTIVRTSEEALKSVSRSLHEGSVALGATKVQTIFRVVLPAAFPAIASGVILAIGRALGETAALIYTMGSNYNLTSGLFSSTRTLAVHIYLIIAEGISSERAFASGTVLIFFILIINTSARLVINRMGRMARA